MFKPMSAVVGYAITAVLETETMYKIHALACPRSRSLCYLGYYLSHHIFNAVQLKATSVIHLCNKLVKRNIHLLRLKIHQRALHQRRWIRSGLIQSFQGFTISNAHQASKMTAVIS